MALISSFVRFVLSRGLPASQTLINGLDNCCLFLCLRLRLSLCVCEECATRFCVQQQQQHALNMPAANISGQ